MTVPLLHPATRTRVEQMLALAWSEQGIANLLGLPLAAIQAVRADLDVINTETDTERPDLAAAGRRRRKAP